MDWLRFRGGVIFWLAGWWFILTREFTPFYPTNMVTLVVYFTVISLFSIAIYVLYVCEP